ncbi:PTS sugar transporter [Tsukamurella soli]|uniref:PTS sugar transporter n=1 Tax=Tsukamurella soli TaxID=644556 RepID=A0ABP8KCE6_9ACTN
MRRIALLGSSGGNLHRLGGADPAQLIRSIQDQLARTDLELAAACFVSADGSLDSLTTNSTGTLWTLDQNAPRIVATGLLTEMNGLARTADRAIADAIDRGEIDGLILVSADPSDINTATVATAAARGLPVVGSGGSSVAAANALGARLVAASGTTGTTNHTRAIGYAAGFAREWGLRYRAADLPRTPHEWWRKYDPRPILVDALPAVLAVSFVIGLLRYLPADAQHRYTALLQPLILIVVAFTASARTSNVGQAGMLAGVLAGVMSAHSGLLGALIGGYLAGFLADLLVTAPLRRNWPATTANILGSGIAGVVAGAIVYLGLQRPGAALNSWLNHILSLGLAHAGWLIGGLLGAAMWTIMMRGFYHSLILPLMVVEFSERGLSFLAAVDMSALVAVSAGLALANVLLPQRTGDRGAARHTLTVNLAFGTFVEGSVPYLRRNHSAKAVAVVAATAGAVIIGAGAGYGVTYIPIPALPLVGDHWQCLALGAACAAAVALLGSLLINGLDRIRTPVPPAGPVSAG